MTSTLDQTGISCPHCRHVLTIAESDVSMEGGEVVHIIPARSLFRCPSCGSYFSLKDGQGSSYSGTNIIYVGSALLVGLGIAYAILSLLGLSLPLPHL
jgi:transposase-like protein